MVWEMVCKQRGGHGEVFFLFYQHYCRDVSWMTKSRQLGTLWLVNCGGANYTTI